MLPKAARQWISSPLGLNILLSVLKQDSPTVEKYKQLTKLLRKTSTCSVHTKLFVSSSSKLKDGFKNSMNSFEIEETDFSKHENAISAWTNENGDLNIDVAKEFSSKTEFIMANITLFKSNWLACTNSGPMMKIYNSFNYTQDVKYEARLLELPLQSDFKLVLVVPNELDVMRPLFTTLTNQGLDAAVRSIQPLFTTSCALSAPNIDVTSRIEDGERISAIANSSTVQYGSLVVNDSGITVKVLTCIYSPSNTAPAGSHHQSDNQAFYLAVVYENTPLFLGQFTQ